MPPAGRIEASIFARWRRFDARQSIELRARQGELAGGDAALDVLADIEELSECGFFVLVLRSAVSRLAYALSMGRGGAHRPLISMQWAFGGPGAHPPADGRRVHAKHGKLGLLMRPREQRGRATPLRGLRRNAKRFPE